MDNEDLYLAKKARRTKESVYEQLRKILCIHVVGGDVTYDNCPPLENLTIEQVRTVFNNGYKLAMNQTLDSLKKLKKIDEVNNETLELLIREVEDRLITCECFTTYESHTDQNMLEQAIKRANEFQLEVERKDLSAWGIKRM